MMQLHGSIEGNLIAAIRSAVRFREHPVHAETIRHWQNLLRHGQQELRNCAALPSQPLQKLVMELEIELAKRPI